MLPLHSKQLSIRFFVTSTGKKCDQIGRFIGLWATFQSPRQQLVCPNLSHSQAIFVKVSKSLIIQCYHFWATFIDIWRLFTGHTVCEPRQARSYGDPQPERLLNIAIERSSKLRFQAKKSGANKQHNVKRGNSLFWGSCLAQLVEQSLLTLVN